MYKPARTTSELSVSEMVCHASACRARELVWIPIQSFSRKSSEFPTIEIITTPKIQCEVEGRLRKVVKIESSKTW